MGIDFKQMTLDYLKDTPIGKTIELALQEFERVQLAAYNLATTKDEKGLTMLRIGTVLTFAVINTMSQGKKPKEFTAEDWNKIAHTVIDYGINVDDEIYSIMVFETYADYLRVSAELMRERVSEDAVEQINNLSLDIKKLTEDLRVGMISEVTYIEGCMWISLEGIIKLLAAYSTRLTCPEIKRFVEGATSYAFEYGRFVLYAKEQEIVTGYLEGQEKLNEELRLKYEEYIKELQVQSEIFEGLVNNAFASDFREMLKGSVEMARSVGVDESEILKSVDDIDVFFCN